jgi:hypothetical protein
LNLDLNRILNDPSVLELKRLANDLKAHPERINAKSLSFPEAWASVWKSAKGQPLQDKIRARWGNITLIAQTDGSVGVSASSSGDWYGQGGPGQGQLNLQRDLAAKARAQACGSVVREVQASARQPLTYDEAWRLAESENRKLFLPQG